MAEPISDDAWVVRGGLNRPEYFRRGWSTHPTGVQGVSVECGTIAIELLALAIPHSRIGVCTVRQIRAAGGDVKRTSGRSENHATLTGLTSEQMAALFSVVANPNFQK